MKAYNDTKCSGPFEAFSQDMGVCTPNNPNNEIDFRNCSTSIADYVFPEGPSYATYSFFDEDNCVNPLSYSGLMNGACLPSSATASVRITYPGVVYYPQSTTCGGALATYFDNFFNPECDVNDDAIISQFEGQVVNNDDPLTTTYKYRQAGIYTVGPTGAPTQSPTTTPSTGWVYNFANPGNSCSDFAPYARGYATDVCLPATATQAVKYSCLNSK